MSVTSRLVMAFTISITVLADGTALAEGAGRDKAGGSSNGSTGVVDVWAVQDPIVHTGSSGDGPVCDWYWTTVGDWVSLGRQGSGSLTADELAAHSVTIRNGVTYRIYLVTCPGEATQVRLVNPNRVRGLVRDAASDVADELIELPLPDINPPATPGGIVNLGMWLAVQPQTYPAIHAEAGTAWITVAPIQSTTTFDFGDGTSVTCTGTGTPIVDLDTIEQGPCGYTYDQPGDDTITITSTWELPYTSSSGPGALPPLVRTSTIAYHVREVQTIGTETD